MTLMRPGAGLRPRRLRASERAGASPQDGERRERDAALSRAVIPVDLDIGLGEVAGPNPRPALPEPEIDRDRHLVLLHDGGGRGLVVAGIARALDAPPGRRRTQIERRSRSAGSPALPTAMTTRPQLASSPATAVFTSGEFAIDMAMRWAERVALGARDLDGDELAGALAVARDLLGEVARGGRRARPGRRRGADRPRASIRAPPARPVANRRSVSEVEVSPSTVHAVEALRGAGRRAAPAARAPRSAASVKQKDSMVAMSGAIMPAPLAMPLMVTSPPPSRDAAGSRPSGRCRSS